MDRLATLLHDTIEGIVIYDAQGIVQFANEPARRIVGASCDLVGESGASFLHPEDRETAYAAFLDFAAARGSSLRIRQRIVTNDGDIRWIDARLINRLGESPVDGIVSYFADITDFKRAEEELSRAQRLDGLGEAAGHIAHDLSNLLVVILGNIDLLRIGGGGGDSAKSSLDCMSHATESASELTAQLLAFSRFKPLSLCGVNVWGFVDQRLRFLRKLLPSRIHLFFDRGNNDCTIYVDPARLEQALVNLVVNARDAISGPGRVEISVRVAHLGVDALPSSKALQTGDYVVIAVEDTGEGISEEAGARLFEAFFSTKERTGGTGLGLAIVERVVSESGGFVEYSSTVGRGSEFRLNFPLYFGEINAPRFTDNRSAALIYGQGTLLVVDDDPMVLDFMNRSLTLLGYQVHAAHSGEEALAVYSAHQDGIDLVITDSVMPADTVDGMSLIEYLTSLRSDLPVLMVSGLAQDHGEFAALHHANFLAKPFGILRLSKAVEQALRH